MAILYLVQNVPAYLDKPRGIRQTFIFILVDIDTKIQALTAMSMLVEGHFPEQDFIF